MIAAVATVASAAVGIGYRAYLVATPFPPAWVRGVALLWFVGALGGVCLGLIAAVRRRPVPLALASLLLGLPNVAFAAIFLMAALMGDVVEAPVPET